MVLGEISTKPVIENLRNLRELRQGESDIIYQFGEFLANSLERYHPTLDPAGFVIAVELGLNDLKNGDDRSLGQEPIREYLVRSPPLSYKLLSERIPDLADASCPEDFAQELRKLYG